jgi:hypothetical protein
MSFHTYACSACRRRARLAATSRQPTRLVLLLLGVVCGGAGGELVGDVEGVAGDDVADVGAALNASGGNETVTRRLAGHGGRRSPSPFRVRRDQAVADAGERGDPDSFRPAGCRARGAMVSSMAVWLMASALMASAPGPKRAGVREGSK